MTISAANLRYQDYQFQVSVNTGVWRWVTRMDVTGSSPTFQIMGITSPYGILRDSIPIPGDVVQAMSSSISEIMSNFPPAILLSPPASPLVFEVDEGRGFSDTENVIVSNDGIFGSILGCSISASASYISVSPANVGNLAANESGSFDVAVDSTNLFASSSPYSETVTAQDPNATNTPQTLPITINVRPKATIDGDPATLGFSVTKPLDGSSFPPIPSQQFTVENTGPAGSVLDFQVQALTGTATNWLSGFAPVTGILTSGGTQVINVSVAPITSLPTGTYQEVLRISGYSTNSYVDVTVQLVIL